MDAVIIFRPSLRAGLRIVLWHQHVEKGTRRGRVVRALAIMADEDTCPVCFETYSAKLRARCSCPFCERSTCKKCLETYLLMSPSDPDCMMCKRTWLPEFVDSLLTRAFRTSRLKPHREAVLMDRERSMLPATQEFAQRVIAYRKVIKEYEALLRKRDELDVQIEQMMRHMAAMRNGTATQNTSAVQNDRWRLVKPCAVEGCRGFLDARYVCGVCEAKVCPECHEPLKADQEHQCDPAVVANVNAIAKDSRPCPNCGAMIFRISGCSQMYCTMPGCNTAFDWNTGERVRDGRIHNPHYYEYLRMTQARGGAAGRELDDIPCGGLPTARAINGFLVGLPYLAKEVSKELIDAHRLASHVQEVELRTVYAAPAAANFESNRDLRVAYLLGELQEDAMKRMLHTREKHRLKVQAIHDVLSTFSNVASDNFRGLWLQTNVHTAMTTAQTTHDEMLRLRAYINESMAGVSKRFSCVVPTITPTWTLVRRRM
jgi:hypothetical protein